MFRRSHERVATAHCPQTNARRIVNSLAIHISQSLRKDDYLVATASLSLVLAMAQASTADDNEKHEGTEIREEDVAAAMQYTSRLLEGKSDLIGNEVILFQNIWMEKERRLSKKSRRLLGTYYCCEAQIMPTGKNNVNERKLKMKLRKLDVSKKFHKQFDAANFQKISNQEMLLTSAVHIAMSWREQFQSILTRECQFHVSHQETVQVDMMTLKSGLVCLRYDVIRATILKLPVTAHNMSMLLYLPYEKNGLEFLENNLTEENFRELLEKLESSKPKPVNISIPRFSLLFNDIITKEVLETSPSLKEFHFKKQEAVPGSQVFHTISVDVNEQGINVPLENQRHENTMIGPAVLDGIRWTTFTADHPFLFMLLEMNTKMIFISGKVSKPQRNQRNNPNSYKRNNEQKRNYCCM